MIENVSINSTKAVEKLKSRNLEVYCSQKNVSHLFSDPGSQVDIKLF